MKRQGPGQGQENPPATRTVKETRSVVTGSDLPVTRARAGSADHGSLLAAFPGPGEEPTAGLGSHVSKASALCYSGCTPRQP